MTDEKISYVASTMKGCLSSHNVHECAIILDGNLLMHQSRLVYVKLVDNKEFKTLEFYTKNSTSSGDTEKKELPTQFRDIIKALTTNEIGGVKVIGLGDLEKCSIKICDNLRFLILESQLYHTIRTMVEQGKTKGHSFVFEENTVDAKDVTRLVNAFLRTSLTSYCNLVYSNHSVRFVNKLRKLNRFYSIQSAFVPVFIEYDPVFNPFGKTNELVQKTELYQLAVEKNRFVTIGNNLSCYFLTHAEICRALGMHQFMRFTPTVLFQVYTGLLYPGYSEFPNKLTKSMIRLESPLGSRYRNHYSSENFMKILSKLNDEMKTADEERKAEILQLIAELQEFQEVDSLFTLCLENHSRLTNIGSHILDEKENTTVAKLRQYLDSAVVKMVE